MQDKLTDEQWLALGLNQKAVYVAGPVTSSGWIVHNIRLAVDAAEELANAGLQPFIPHFNIYWDMIYPQHSYEFWLYRMTLPWLSRCDYLLRVPGESRGADAEVAAAISLNVPVFYTPESLILHCREAGEI